MKEDKEQWYSNKDLFEMVQELQKQIGALTLEIQHTATLIRDYNGLREKISSCEKALEETRGKSTGYKDMWGWVVAAISLLYLILSKVKL